MIIHSRTLKLSNDNSKVFNWILDNFVNTTVKNDVLVIMKRIMNSLRRRLTDVNDLWSRFPSTPIVLYMMEQRYEVQFNCSKQGIKINILIIQYQYWISDNWNINLKNPIDMHPYPKPIGNRISEKVNIPYLRDKLLPRSAHAMFCIPSEPFSAELRSDARCGSKINMTFENYFHCDFLNQFQVIQTKCSL